MYASVCVGSCKRVERVHEADRVGYSPCSKPLAVKGYLSQQMPERGRCFSSSMRQIPGARFILYLFSYLFIPERLGASPLHTNTIGQHLPLCACDVVVRERHGINVEMVQWDPESEQVTHKKRHMVWESNTKTVLRFMGGYLSLCYCMCILCSVLI